MNNKNYFNSRAHNWDCTNKPDEIKIKKIMDIICINKESKVLDVGTGTGVMIPYLISDIGNNGEITAVDEADKMIEIACSKYNYKNVKFSVGNVLEIELPENYFDLINCYSMFPHFHDQNAAIRILARYLKKGGKFVISHSHSRNTINNIHNKISEFVKTDKLPTVDKINEYFKSAQIQMINSIDDDEMFVVIGEKK